MERSVPLNYMPIKVFEVPGTFFAVSSFIGGLRSRGRCLEERCSTIPLLVIWRADAYFRKSCTKWSSFSTYAVECLLLQALHAFHAAYLRKQYMWVYFKSWQRSNVVRIRSLHFHVNISFLLLFLPLVLGLSGFNIQRIMHEKKKMEEESCRKLKKMPSLPDLLFVLFLLQRFFHV